jgi:hypothetical protein
MKQRNFSKHVLMVFISVITMALTLCPSLVLAEEIDLDADDDNDSIPNLFEVGPGYPQEFLDTNEDGIANYLDNDDDGDGILTINEGITFEEPDIFTAQDTDDDGDPDYLDTDDDGDSYPTSIEGSGDSNENGIPAYLDADEFPVVPTPTGSPAVVTASVTVQSISITIPDGWPTSVNYGVVALDTEATPVSYSPASYGYLRVANNGPITVDIYIKGTNAIYDTYTWALAGLNGKDQYVHFFGTGQNPSTYTALNTSGQLLSSGIVNDGMVDFNLKLKSPTETSGYGEYTTTVTLVAMASE